MMREGGDSRVQIAFLIDTMACDTSGTEKQLVGIIKRIDKTRFFPHLICLYESAWMLENHLPCSCTVLGYEGLLKASLPTVLKSLRKIIAEKKITIIQTFFEDSIFVAWLATRFIRCNIVLLSSRRDMGLGTGNQPWYHQLFALALPWVNRGFDGILANCVQVKEYVAKREKTSPTCIDVLYNGVSLPRETPDPLKIFDSAPGVVWIVMVASLSPVKRHDLLIAAVSRLVTLVDRKSFKVLLLGKGLLRDQLMALIQEKNVQDVFLFAGVVAKVPDYLSNCDIGVLCSDREGLSNAIIEYMASGLPVVATAVGGNVELVDKKNGICVPPGDSIALADALNELIMAPERRKRMGLVSCKRVEDEFSWQHSMRQLERYYERKIVEKGMASDQ